MIAGAVGSGSCFLKVEIEFLIYLLYKRVWTLFNPR